MLDSYEMLEADISAHIFVQVSETSGYWLQDVFAAKKYRVCQRCGVCLDEIETIPFCNCE